MRWTIKNSLYLGFALLGVLVVVFASIAHLAHTDADATQQDILRTSRLLHTMEQLKVFSLEITLLQRAYVISGDVHSIARLPALREELDQSQKMVESAITGNAALHFRRYQTCVGLRRAFVNKVIKAVEDQKITAARALEATGEEDRLMNCIDAEIQAMQDQVVVRAQTQEAVNRNLQKRIALTELLTALLALALLTGMGIQLTAVTIAHTHLYANLVHRSAFDQLTDIPNRFHLEQRLRELLQNPSAGGSHFALIYIDLDHFKQINDNYGHAAGDLFLQHVVQRMKNQLRPEDMLARLGGDEFAALVLDIPDHAHAMEIIARLERAFERPFQIENRLIPGAASMGVALCPQDGVSFDTLLKAADTRMYAVKDSHHLRQSPEAFSQIPETE
jgi:diguanylate cyclase (GGDEF)-like protein